MLQFNQILYITTSTVDSRDKMVYYQDLSFLILKNITLDALSEMLPEKDFVRINKREIISLHHIKYFHSDNVTLDVLSKENKVINLVLSEVYKANFIAQISI